MNTVKSAFQNVRELILCNNKCNRFEDMEVGKDTFPNLERIDLGSNGIEDMENMAKWYLPNLKELTLSYNNIQFLTYSKVYENLQTLNIQGNNIDKLKLLLDFLSCLKSLTSIRFLNNPVLSYYDKD